MASSSSFSSRSTRLPSYSARDLSPRSGSSTPSGVPELVSSASDSTREPSFDWTPSTTPTSDILTRLEPGQAPLLFSSPQIINQRGLFPDPRSLKNQLDLAKDRVHLTLRQKFIFLYPPPSSSDQEGPDAHVSGFVHITAAKEKTIEGLSVTLIGHRKAYLPSNGGSAEETDILRREVVLGGWEPGGQGIHLNSGLNSFEFSLSVPASTMPHERTPVGTVVYTVRAQVLGLKKSFFGSSTMEDEASLKFVTIPSRDEGVPTLSLSRTSLDSTIGLYNIRLSASQLTVGGPLDVSVHLASPPPGLTLFAVNVYAIQTVDVASIADPRKTHKLIRPRACVLQLGDKGPYGSKGAAERMRKAGVLWENAREGGEEWIVEKMARMPHDGNLRPTTHDGTISSLRVSNEILVEIVFSVPRDRPPHSSSSAEETVQIMTVVREPIVVYSCCAFLDSVNLPNYQEGPDPLVLPTNDCPCLCQPPWDAIEKREMAFRETRRVAEERAMGSAEGRFEDHQSPEEEAGLDVERGRKIGESW